MATPLVPNDLWAAIEPLLPLEPARPKGGRPRVSGHVALAGILFVLRMGIQLWNVLGGPKGGGAETGPSPTDRGKAGTKRHLVADATARRSV